jgi:hypothetical protein
MSDLKVTAPYKKHLISKLFGDGAGGFGAGLPGGDGGSGGGGFAGDVGDGGPVALGLPFAHDELDAYGATAGFAGVGGPLFSVSVAAERFLGVVGDLAFTWLKGSWHECPQCMGCVRTAWVLPVQIPLQNKVHRSRVGDGRWRAEPVCGDSASDYGVGTSM